MKADKKLEELGVEFEEVVQDKPTTRCGEAAEERGVDVSQIVKSLIIESEGEKFHVLLPGDRELSEKKFGAEYRLLPPEESRNLTGFESGAVHPFSTELDHVVDERVLEHDKVSHTTGEKKRGVILGSEEFREALEKSEFELEIRDIVTSTEADFQEIESRGLNREEAKFVADRGYRKVFKELCQEYEAGDVFDLLKAFDREEVEVERDRAGEVLRRAENQSHMQRLAKELAEKGKLPEEESFDLEEKVSTVLEENPDAVEDFMNGRESAANFLLGKLMDETNGKADPGEAKQKILNQIDQL